MARTWYDREARCVTVRQVDSKPAGFNADHSRSLEAVVEVGGKRVTLPLTDCDDHPHVGGRYRLQLVDEAE